MAQRYPVRESGDRTLDARIADVLSNMTADGDSVPGALGMPDSLRVMITFGQNADGSPFVVSHTRCPAVPYPDNPAAVVPERASGIASTVRLRAIVSASGRVDTASVHVDESSDDRLIDAAMTAVSQMRYVPAEFDGAKISERVDIVVPFASGDRAEVPPTR
jgi:TonB family protein